MNVVSGPPREDSIPTSTANSGVSYSEMAISAEVYVLRQFAAISVLPMQNDTTGELRDFNDTPIKNISEDGKIMAVLVNRPFLLNDESKIPAGKRWRLLGPRPPNFHEKARCFDWSKKICPVAMPSECEPRL